MKEHIYAIERWQFLENVKYNKIVNLLVSLYGDSIIRTFL